MKINFTDEHFAKMQELLMEMLIFNKTISGKLGQPINVIELLHTTSIQGLNNIRISLSKQIENLENQDEWIASPLTQSSLNELKSHKELVNLVIGYKRYRIEVAEQEAKRAELIKKIARMKEEAKTPEDRLREAEEELAALDSTEG